MNMVVRSAMKNYLGLFNTEGNVDVEKTRNFMEVSREELADIFKLTPDQLRPSRMGKKTKDKLTELAGALEFVADSYEGDVVKTKFWVKTPNPHLGGSTPRELILRGRYKKVMQFILSAEAS